MSARQAVHRGVLVAAGRQRQRPQRADLGLGAGEGPYAAVRSAIARLDEIPGVRRHTAQVILAETGLDMARFPTAAHLASWAKLSPRTIQSGARKNGKMRPLGLPAEAVAVVTPPCPTR